MERSARAACSCREYVSHSSARYWLEFSYIPRVRSQRYVHCMKRTRRGYGKVKPSNVSVNSINLATENSFLWEKIRSGGIFLSAWVTLRSHGALWERTNLRLSHGISSEYVETAGRNIAYNETRPHFIVLSKWLSVPLRGGKKSGWEL